MIAMIISIKFVIGNLLAPTILGYHRCLNMNKSPRGEVASPFLRAFSGLPGGATNQKVLDNL